MRELHGRRSDGTRGAVYEHRLALLDFGAVPQEVECGGAPNSMPAASACEISAGLRASDFTGATVNSAWVRMRNRHAAIRALDPDYRSAVRLVAVASSGTTAGTKAETSGGRHSSATVTCADTPSGADAATS